MFFLACKIFNLHFCSERRRMESGNTQQPSISLSLSLLGVDCRVQHTGFTIHLFMRSMQSNTSVYKNTICENTNKYSANNLSWEAVQAFTNAVHNSTSPFTRTGSLPRTLTDTDDCCCCSWFRWGSLPMLHSYRKCLESVENVWLWISRWTQHHHQQRNGQ